MKYLIAFGLFLVAGNAAALYMDSRGEQQNNLRQFEKAENRNRAEAFRQDVAKKRVVTATATPTPAVSPTVTPTRSR